MPSPEGTITLLSALQPPSTSRTWQSRPHPNLPLLATACSDRTVRIYSLTSFTLLTSITGGHKRSVRSISWKPNSNFEGKRESVLATGSFDASAGIWRKWEGGGSGDVGEEGDERDGDEEEEEEDYQFSSILDGHESEIKSLAWSTSGQLLATCSRDKSVWIWEEVEDDNFETIAVLQEHEGDVKCVAWHPEEDLLASSSYDDTVRLYKEDVDDWGQVAQINGHEKTVWWIEFEGASLASLQSLGTPPATTPEQSTRSFLQSRQLSGPRLATCSDDCTVRIWRRLPKPADQSSAATGIPSIIRSHSIEEEWVQDAILPQSHDRAIYSLSWSHATGLLASAGSDGKIVVYRERWKSESGTGANGVSGSEAGTGEAEKDGTGGTGNGVSVSDSADADGDHVMKDAHTEQGLTEWVVVAEVEGAHDVFEINHVTWARRADKGRRRDDEEIIVSTGDEGEVKVWTVDV